MSLPTTPQGWAIRLTQILSLHQAAHGLPRFPIDVEGLAQDCLLVMVGVMRDVIRSPKEQCRRDRQSTRQLNIETRVADEQELFCNRARWKAKIAFEISPQFRGVGFIGECQPLRAENILRDSADISAVRIRYDRHRVPATLHGFNEFPSTRNNRDIVQGKASITAILYAVVSACIRVDERPV